MADLLYVNSGYVTDHYFVYTADASASVTATSTISANANAIRRVGGGGARIPGTTQGQIAGLLSNSNQFTVLAEGDVLTNPGGRRRPISTNDVFAVWAKKDSISDNNGTLFSVGSTVYNTADYSQTYGHLNVQILSASVKLTISFGGTNPPYGGGTYVTYMSTPTSEPFFKYDGNWHHYMFFVSGSWFESSGSIGFSADFQIWQDGNQFSFGDPWSPSTPPSNTSLVYTSEKYFLGAELPPPTDQYFDQDGYRGPYYSPGTLGWNGTLAEFWYGNLNLGTTGNPAKLYNAGWVDPTTSGAPTAYAYASLADPTTESNLSFYRRTTDREQTTVGSGGFIGYNGPNTPKNLQATFSLSTAIKRLTGGKSTGAISSFSIRAITGPVRQARATLASRYTVSKALATATFSAKAQNNIRAVATVSKALANPIKQVSKTLSAAFSFRGRSTTAVFGRATLTSAFSVKAKTSASSKGKINVAATLFAHPVKTRFATSTITARATLRANGGLYFNGNFRITVVSLLSASLTQVPRSDDDLTVPVEAETRTLRVLEELRLCTEEATNRVNRTLYEDRCLIVPQESRTIREVMLPVIEITPARIRRLPA